MDIQKKKRQNTFSLWMSSPSKLTGGSIANRAMVWRIWLWTISRITPCWSKYLYHIDMYAIVTNQFASFSLGFRVWTMLLISLSFRDLKRIHFHMYRELLHTYVLSQPGKKLERWPDIKSLKMRVDNPNWVIPQIRW